MNNRRPNLPNWSGGNNPDPSNQIAWVESDDVYKPIPKTMIEFIEERGIQNNDFTKVYIKENALNILKRHLGSNLRVEQGGILFGNAYQDPTSGIIYVEITVAVPAPATIGTGAHLEFTADSWLGIIDYALRSHPQENIVGWYHSHPNIGVFMSSTDMNTQRAFFSHPWCLSIVHDPVRKTTGYFLGANATPIYTPVIFEKKPQKTPVIVNNNISENTLTKTKFIEDEPSEKQKPQKLPLALPLIMMGGVIVVILILSLIVSKLLIISQTEPLSPPTSITFKTIPANVWQYFEQDSSLLNYKIIAIDDDQKKNLNGDEITVITIASPQENAKISAVKLKVDKLTINQDNLNNDLTLDDFDPLKTSKKDLNKYGDLEEKSIDINFDNKKEGVIIALYSIKTTPSKNETEAKEIIYYIPIKIIYQDQNQKKQAIEINK